MHHIRAKKALGQNFLTDENILSTIAESISIMGKNIIEVGPGYGALTDYLIVSGPRNLELVELDKDMINLLVNRFSQNNTLGGKYIQGVGGGKLFESDERHNTDEQSERVFSPSKPFASFQLGKEGIAWEGEPKNGKESSFAIKSINEQTQIYIHHQDILTFTPPYTDYSVIANIPYYITSPILFHFLYGLPCPPEEMVIMMQQEVGEKILSGQAKKRQYSYLALAMEEACESIERVCFVPKTAFSPAPKVDSIVLRFVVKNNRNKEPESSLVSLWKVAFTHPRKTLMSNLKGSQYDIEKVKSCLKECGYDDRVRAEEIKREDWGKLL